MMNLRYAADYRTLLWTFVLFPGVALAHYLNPNLVGWLLPLSLYLGYCSGVISHNHNHCPTFQSKKLNNAFSIWLSVFYGYPLYGWIPTHNLNHHRYVNRAGDATITWRYNNKHTLWIASTFFFVSSYWQAGPLREYVAKLRQSNPKMYRHVVNQWMWFVGAHVALAALGIVLWGPTTGLLVYAFGFAIPACFALWSMMFTNYIQHVHCDPWSPDNHSRNFVSPIMNWFVFDAGYHTVHHEHAGTHWSKYKELHAQRSHKIDPALNEHSILTFCMKQYVLGLFFERFRTKQVGRAAYDVGQGTTGGYITAPVAPVDQGVNAAIG